MIPPPVWYLEHSRKICAGPALFSYPLRISCAKAQIKIYSPDSEVTLRVTSGEAEFAIRKITR